MRVYKKNNSIAKITNNNESFLIAYSNFDLIEYDYFKDVICRTIIEQDKKFIVMVGVSYNVKLLPMDSKEQFLEACCGFFGLRLDKKDIIKYI